MHLLRFGDLGELTVTEDLLDNIPPYAVLSHTWGALGGEVLFQDIGAGYYKHKPGYRKILFCGAQARRDGIEYFWVDTCCIDKTSSAELSEAINSMYRWYQNAEKCYVYLSDVTVSDEGLGIKYENSSSYMSVVPNYTGLSYTSRSFHTGVNYTCSNYISRNLLAGGNYSGLDYETPPPVSPADTSWLDAFRGTACALHCGIFDSNGRMVGDKQSLKQTIYAITGIPLAAFQGGWQSAIPVHERISWSHKRETGRAEDKVYSLLGIVGVSMPVVYGEGEAEAFIRLCKEMIQRYDTYKAIASRCGHALATRKLVNGGAAVNSPYTKGESPIMYASEGATKRLFGSSWMRRRLPTRGGHEAVVRLLLDKGANIKRKNKGGRTALMYAAHGGHDGVLRLLLRKLQKGAGIIEAKDNRSESAISVAARKGHEAVVRVLLEKGAQIESKDRAGSTPLMLAASNGHDAVVRLLLEKGAKLDSVNRLGHSAKQCASKCGHKETVKLLQSSRQTSQTRPGKQPGLSGVQGILRLMNT
ncbi:WD40 repeat-like protein [Apiospora rasikravindrae]|uniref:WD40 repeat-like protein n=1 Tax=Apiospora rasikravindrae TaxID=990691 RepID=A0ABR1TEV3_9PEZI